jgi:hypothetical protein
MPLRKQSWRRSHFRKQSPVPIVSEEHRGLAVNEILVANIHAFLEETLHQLILFPALKTQRSGSLSNLATSSCFELLKLSARLLAAHCPSDRLNARVFWVPRVKLVLGDPQIPHAQPRLLVSCSAEAT